MAGRSGRGAVASGLHTRAINALPDVSPNDTADAVDRGVWSSKLGFVLAASGSAIGLGNIVFFASNAYQFGGGAFYVPYFIALFVLGIPVMITEFSLGTMTGRSFPMALSKVVGAKGEFVGWWSLGSALFITMYYITILGWAFCMMVGALFGLMEGGATAPFARFLEPSTGPNATAYFFGILSSWWPMIAVIAIWGMTLMALLKGTETIEKTVRVAVPLMWLFMIVLIIRGVTLPGGTDGVMYLFTPDLAGIAQPDVWKGAFSQMFFSLSLGLGTMTAYASYLPKDSDQVNNSFMVSLLNCGFEYIAGIAIFSMLFAFALNPAGSTLSLSFFAIPQGIAAFPFGVKLFGFAFFFLSVMAGVTSAISLVEGMASALIDKLGIDRKKALLMVAVPGLIGSMVTALPFIVDPGLAGNGTVGLNFLDILDHWAFGYSLLTVGLIECVLLGWVFGAGNLRAFVNQHSKLKLGAWFDVLLRFIIPAILLTVIVWNLVIDLTGEQLYGAANPLGFVDWFPVVIPILWIVGTLSLATYLTRQPSAPDPTESPIATFEA